MPDPAWTQQYSMTQTPEQNGFTRTLYNTPVVTTQTSGSPANRRVEINSNNGDAVFLTSQIPAIDSDVGVTMEAVLSCNGSGDAGFEVTFLDLAFLIMVFSDRIDLTLCQDALPGQIDISVPTAANTSDIEMRATVDGSSMLRVYRNDILISGPHQLNTCDKPFQRVLWWGEGGGTQIFRALRYYLGGAVAPG